jgi:hypothetical protein
LAEDSERNAHAAFAADVREAGIELRTGITVPA